MYADRRRPLLASLFRCCCLLVLMLAFLDAAEGESPPTCGPAPQASPQRRSAAESLLSPCRTAGPTLASDNTETDAPSTSSNGEEIRRTSDAISTPKCRCKAIE